MSKRRSSKRGQSHVLPGQLDMFASETRVVDRKFSTDTALSRSGQTVIAPSSLQSETAASSVDDVQTKAIRTSQAAEGINKSPSSRKTSGASTMKAVERNEEALLDTRTAARRVGLGVSTLEKMRCQGRGPRFVKLTNSAVRYHPGELDAWVARRVRVSTERKD